MPGPKAPQRATKAREPTPAQILAENRVRAQRMAREVGVARVRRLLQRAEAELRGKLSAVGSTKEDDEPFTIMRLRATLAQVRDVVSSLKHGMKGELVRTGKETAEAESAELLEYLNRAEKRFKGISTQALGLDQARVVDRAVAGAESSVLRRIETDPNHRGNPGVLDRYGGNVIQNFEETLQMRLVTRAPWADVREQITRSSPFLRQAPAHWAERITRTEVMHANNTAALETIKAADEELDGMCKILSCTFDGRTGADSVAVHGQIRRVSEPFESWNGSFQAPPDRPNDRASVVPHREGWPIPAGLAWKSAGDIAAAWAREGRKGSPPGRPKMTTVDLKKFQPWAAPADEPKPEPQPEPEPQPTPAAPVGRSPIPGISLVDAKRMAADARRRAEEEPVEMQAAEAAPPGVPIPPPPRARRPSAREMRNRALD